MDKQWRKLIQHDLMNIYNEDVMDEDIAERVKVIIKKFIENLTKHNSSSKKDCSIQIPDHDFTSQQKKDGCFDEDYSQK